jgi:hypothetical protein
MGLWVCRVCEYYYVRALVRPIFKPLVVGTNTQASTHVVFGTKTHMLRCGQTLGETVLKACFDDSSHTSIGSTSATNAFSCPANVKLR